MKMIRSIFNTTVKLLTVNVFEIWVIKSSSKFAILSRKSFRKNDHWTVIKQYFTLEYIYTVLNIDLCGAFWKVESAHLYL